MNVEEVKLSAVQPHPKNVRQGDVGAISESLKAHGQYKPIVVQRSTGLILAGNHTWRAAKALKWPTIQIVWVDVDDEEALRILLVDNRTTDLATYDDHALLELLTVLAASDSKLAGTGYALDDVDDLLHDTTPDTMSVTSEAGVGVCPECGQVI